MVNNFANIKLQVSSKLNCLLLIFFIFSCKNEISKKDFLEKKDLTEKINDSIIISIKFKDNGLVILNTGDDNFYSKKIEFSNKFSKDTILQRRIKKHKGYQIFEYGSLIRKNNKFSLVKQYFMITPETQHMNLEFSNMKLLDNNSYYSNELDYIFKSYDTIKLHILKNEKIDVLTKKLEVINSALNKKYLNHKEKKIIQLYKTLYIDVLQGIDNKNSKITEYIKNMNDPILGGPFAGLMFNTIRYNINEIDFENIKSEKYSKKEIHFTAAGLFNYLKFDHNYKKRNLEKSIAWLKTTDFYKKDSIFIKKEITPLSNLGFKENLRALNLLDINIEKNSIAEILKKHPANYYLIDFWATWCAPCIQGVKKMKEMNLPKNVKIISISLDKEKDKEKWKSKTKELEQSYSYWLDENSSKGKIFLKFIELQSIPRYILIDKNMNLIDQSFLHPSEPQFLPKLKDIENSKYW